MTVTFLDTQTGETCESCDLDEHLVVDGNWSCDCNRSALFGVHLQSNGLCVGRKRFIAIQSSDPGCSMKELNADYPTDLLKAHGIV